MQEYKRLSHGFGPYFDENSRILILGSFPSASSREQGFYYANPQNRFWKVLAAVTNSPVPVSLKEKKAFLTKNNIALWDVISECDIKGSSDASIKNVIATDLGVILGCSETDRIYANGAAAYRLFEKYQREAAGIAAVRLPSTSPANAAWSFERLTGAWRVIIS